MSLRIGYLLSIILGVIVIYVIITREEGQNSTEVLIKESNTNNIVDPTSALVDDKGVMIVRANCLGCHSEKIITQNRATREGWESTIRWMQETQNLWDLGENESEILDYLARNYDPEQKGRRAQLQVEWYELAE